MQFGEDKCSYLQIEKGELMQSLKLIFINGITIKPIKEGGNYKYLGIDENISYNGAINKERVNKENVNRIRKNRAVAHNTFAVPILTSTVGISDLTCKTPCLRTAAELTLESSPGKMRPIKSVPSEIDLDFLPPRCVLVN